MLKNKQISIIIEAIFIVFISFIIIITVTPSSYAADIVASGTQDSIEWMLDSEGVLTIRGDGDIWWSNETSAPWYSNKDAIKSVVIEDGITGVSTFAFANCIKMTSIVIPESVKIISEFSFFNCSSLTNITLPNGVTSIGSEAFHGCSSLTSITIPDSVTSIGAYAFQDCSSLANVTIPESITSIGEYTFFNCSSLASITIPDSVTSIGENAFRECRSLTSVKIPDGVKNIEKYSFYSSGLKEIKLSDNLESIGMHAFQGCTELTDIIIPEGVNTIEDYAFTSCNSLRNITVPGSVTSIGYAAFASTICPTIYTVPNSYVSTFNDPAGYKYNIEYLCESCESNSNYLSFSSNAIFIKNGEVVGLSDYLLTNLNISDCTVTVSDESLFIYDDGEIASLGIGECIITVTNGDFSASASIISQDVAANIEDINFKDDTLNLSKGDTYVNTITIVPKNSDVDDVVWKSSDDSVATVSNGKINAVSSGTATIIAYSSSDNKIYDQCEVKVTTPLYNIVPLESEITIEKGAMYKLQYYKYPYDTTNNVSFKSDNEDVVTIDENGKLTAKGAGEANIVISSGDITKSVKITVYIPLTSLSLEQTLVTASCGDQIQMTPILEPEDTTETDIIWSSSKEAVASVDEYGLVTVHTKGIATITATNGDYTATCKIICSSHTWNEDYTIDWEPTCTEEGSKSIHCSVCDAINEESITAIPANGHTWDSGMVTTEPTCTEEGETTYTCIVCDDKKTEAIDAIGHKWNEEYTVDKEATCTEEGSKSIHCSICNDIDESSVTVIPKAEHTYGDWKVTKEATCTEDGSKVKVCEVCYDKVTEVIPATGHSFSEDFIIDTPVSCTTDGSKSRHCAHCDEICDVTVIPATGHTFGEWVEVTASTCENEGLRQHTCEVCGTVESENLDPKGHDFDEEYTIDVPATCTTDGSQSRHCKNCDAVTDSEVIPATGHSFGDWDVTKEATCVETGLKERVCSVCSEKETEIIPLTDHRWETNPTVDKAATCEEDGSQSIHCAICGAKDESTVTVIPKTGHDWNEPTYAWSDDNSSVTATRTCRNDSNHKESATAKSTSEVTKAATYTAKGETTYTAVFDNEVFTKQTKTVADIPVLERTSIEKATVSNVVAKVYTGKALTQTPTIKVGTKTLKSGTDYKLTYKNNKNVGKATVTITGLGAYKGTISKTFKINPKGTTLKTLTSTSKGFKATWNKQSTKMSTSYITGYQIQYSTSSKFTTATTKTAIATKYSTVSKTISKLKAKKKYYVRIRTYKTVNGVKYYSPWSASKYVTTKA